MDVEKLLIRVSMIVLLVTGAIFIYEGIKYINIKKENPNLSDKLYVAGAFALTLGVVEIAFGVFHFYMKGF